LCRYVDTFNKGSGASAFGAATSFSKPAAPSMSPLSGAKFFVPTPAAVAAEQMPGPKVDAEIETAHHDEQSPSPALEAAFSLLPPSEPMSSTIRRHPSMDNIMTPSDRVDSSLSRSKAASWSGAYPGQFSSTAASRSPDGQKMQSPMMPGRRPPHSRSSSNSSVQFSGMVEDLHEVDL
jgi:COPII coat assembly protein SEC16